MKRACNRRWKWTAEVEETICNFVRAGGFPHVAAEAAGVPRAVFAEWMRRGAAPRVTSRNKRFVGFRAAVERARAEARLAAEIRVHREAALAWLRQGPGKERPDNPGWTQAVPPPRVVETNQQINVLCSPELQGVIAALLQVLAPFPEARVAVAKALGGVEPSKLMLPG